ncbi:hypothetical protein B0H11DRAFT_1900492 [Mycena galericulata]|nr:hypothetical protein B0H11DRAFT_1900492 [Mycena galericulata]
MSNASTLQLWAEFVTGGNLKAAVALRTTEGDQKPVVAFIDLFGAISARWSHLRFLGGRYATVQIVSELGSTKKTDVAKTPKTETQQGSHKKARPAIQDQLANRLEPWLARREDTLVGSSKEKAWRKSQRLGRRVSRMPASVGIRLGRFTRVCARGGQLWDRYWPLAVRRGAVENLRREYNFVSAAEFFLRDGNKAIRGLLTESSFYRGLEENTESRR